jgi:hypothetical protein
MAWTPLNLAGCKALYTAKDAASVTATTWKDQTSNHYDLVATSGSPTFDANAFGSGEPGFILDGVDDVFSASGISTNTDKIWCFARIQLNTSSFNNARIATLTVPGGFRDFDVTGCALFTYFGAGSTFDEIRGLRDAAPVGSSGNDPATVAFDVSRTYGIIFDGTNSTGYLRDVAEWVVASSGLFGPTNFLNLSSHTPNAPGAGADFRIMALAFGVGALTSGEITQIVGWLDNPVMGAVGPTAINITGAQTTSLPTQTATAAARVAASATQATSLPTQAATGRARVAASATQATALPTQLALASLPLPGRNYSALQSIALPVQTATGRAIVAAAPAQVTPLPVQAATAQARVSASSTQVLAFPTQVAAATVVPAASHLFVNHNGVWKPATTWVNHAGTWKRPAHIYVNQAGTWKEVA